MTQDELRQLLLQLFNLGVTCGSFGSDNMSSDVIIRSQQTKRASQIIAEIIKKYDNKKY